jgi:hypothetical protein
MSLIVVRPPAMPVELTCDGAALETTEQPVRADAATGSAELGTVLGKRYGDAESGLELLCTRAGAGVLAADGREMRVLSARALPASD